MIFVYKLMPDETIQSSISGLFFRRCDIGQRQIPVRQ